MTEHPNLSAALVAATAELTVVEKGRTANAGSYSYDYADLGDIVKVTRPKLAEHGIALLTPVCDHGDGFAVTVIFLHTSGEERQFGPLSFARGRDAQATGSLITYFRRYAVQAALGIATGDDDDGATAQEAPPQQRPLVKAVHPKVQGLVDLMNGIEDAEVRKTVKGEFVATYGQLADFDLSKLDEAELFIVETVQDLTKPAPAAGQQEESTSGPGPTADAPPAPAEPVTKPAANKPSAAARAALAGEKPTIGAVKRTNDAPTEGETVEALEQAFPGSEREAS